MNPRTITLLACLSGLILSLAMVTFTSFDDIFFIASFVFLAITIILGILLIIKVAKKTNNLPESAGITKLMDPKNPISPLSAFNNKR